MQERKEERKGLPGLKNSKEEILKQENEGLKNQIKNHQMKQLLKDQGEFNFTLLLTLENLLSEQNQILKGIGQALNNIGQIMDKKGEPEEQSPSEQEEEEFEEEEEDEPELDEEEDEENEDFGYPDEKNNAVPKLKKAR